MNEIQVLFYSIQRGSKELCLLTQEVKRRMYFYTFFLKDCVLCFLETLQNKWVLSKIQYIILIIFLLQNPCNAV